VSRSAERVVIVGAGLGGLSAACHLAGRGFDVELFEAGPVPGGRAGTLRRDGYRFDTGPVVLTMPHLIARCLDAVGVPFEDVLPLRTLDPMYRASFADGSVINIRPGREAMAEEIRATCGAEEAIRFEHFCDWLAALYAAEMQPFIERNYDSPIDLLGEPAALWRMVRLGGLRSLATAVSRRFTDPRLRRIFTFQAMYAGLAPYEALAMLAIITYMDVVGGVYYPVGGMHALPAALAEAADRAGVRIHYGTPVERIVLADGDRGPVRGVVVAGGAEVPASAVVCNADLPVAYRTLLPGLSMPRRARRGKYSPSALVWLAGVNGRLPDGTAHHNLHFGAGWDRSFRALLDDGVRMPDPSLLVTVPTVSDETAAPPGRHGMYVLEPVPNLDGRIDWRRERAHAGHDIAGAVARLGYPTDIETEQLLDPLDWEAMGLERGTPFSLAHRFFQSGPFRPANRDRRAPGLVLVGSGTVPGVGIPMVLISGELAARRVSELAAGR
jgi:phytoene desaturase